MAKPPDPSLDDIRVAGSRMAADVLPHFGGELERIETDPRDDPAQFDDQRGEQTVTLLQLLGYLHEPRERAPASGRFEWRGAEIDAAWAMWRQDRLLSALTDDPPLTITTEADDRAVDHPERLRRDLKACATLEGEVRLTRWPGPGAVTLASRILLMRLRLYGLCDDIAGNELPAGAPLPEGLDARLLERARSLNAKKNLDAVRMINLLGDIAGLTTVVQEKLTGRFVVLQSPDSDASLERVEHLDAADTHKIQALNLHNDAMADWNRFSLRLLQVRLWTIGYYRGEIDGEWAQHSHEALEKFFADYEVKKRHTLRGAVDGGFVVLDIARVLGLFAGDVDAPARSLRRTEIDGMLNDPEVQKSDGFWKSVAEEHEQDRKGGEGAPPVAAFSGNDFAVESRENLRRKRYFGWRAVFASFGRFFRKVAKKAAEFVKSVIAAIQNGLRFVHSVVRYAVDATRSVVRVAALAVRRFHCWLTGTPVVTQDAAAPGIVVTLWQRDFDTVNLIDSTAPGELVQRHVRVLDWMQRSLALMVRIGVEVVRLVALAAQALAFAGRWLRFAWQLLGTLRTVVDIVRDPLFAELALDGATT